MSVTIPKLSPARAPRRVAMPRFRSAGKAAMSLTQAVHRVLVRTQSCSQPFGVFALGGRLVLCSAGTDRFKTLKRRSPEAFIATYGPGLKIADALDDLREHFTDGAANGGA